MTPNSGEEFSPSSQPLNINSELFNGVAVISPQGEIDMSTERTFGEEITTALINSEAGLVLIDFSDVRYFDSSGIRQLVLARRQADRYGKDILLFVPNANLIVSKIIELMAIDKAFTVYTDSCAATA